MTASDSSTLLVVLSLVGIVGIWDAVGAADDVAGNIYQDCGGILDQPKGVIHSPNFPGPYPTPIYCEWLIRAKPEEKIILYFTQYYMTDSFHITEYDYYQSRSTYVNRHDIGRISWHHQLAYLTAKKPYAVIQLRVNSIGNRHLRVADKMLDVYGFNVTYEIVDKSADVKKDTCSVTACSYLGNCIVNADFSKHQCQCFEGFFGKNCEHGPYCDPDKGINQCSNGGKCRYFFGSLINECQCPPGFYGAHCEIPAAGSGEGIDEACAARQCSQQCERDADNKAHCVCYDGYKMVNETCIAIARYRMDVRMELTSYVHIPQGSEEETLNEAKEIILKIIEENGASTISKFNMKGLRNTTSGTLLEFYFYCKVSEVDTVDQALAAVVNLRTVGVFTLRNATPKYEKSSELHIEEVTTCEVSTCKNKPVLQGQLLAVVCAAKGSRNMTFNWYKDGHLVDTSLTNRNAWQTKNPHHVPDMQLSVLNIDNASPFDKGTFTCEVNDFGESQWETVVVEVKTYPMVELDPMSASVPINTPFSIKCLSPDDSWRTFTYEWFKNGEQIKPDSKEEYAEEMYPTGVRLVVAAVTDHAEYTCRVTNEAGFANVTSYIHVVHENETHLYCPKDYEIQVMWHNTSGGHFDIQRCPTEQGGYARRHCRCDAVTEQCSWAQPNFAKCQSLILIHIYDELESLRLGYQKTTLKKVFDHLYKFVFPEKTYPLYSGDIDMVASILRELLYHMRNFPVLVERDEHIEAESLLELMSALLEKSSDATVDEKELILVGPNIAEMTATLFDGVIESLLYAADTPLTSNAIDMKVLEARIIPEKLNADDDAAVENPASVPVITLQGEAVGYADILLLKLDHLSDLLQYKAAGKTAPDSVVVSPRIISPVHSVGLFDPRNRSTKTPWLELSIEHSQKLPSLRTNTTLCLSWKYEPSNLFKGEWRKDRCLVEKVTSSRTICHCKVPGHIAVAMVSTNVTEAEDTIQGYDVDEVLVVCYSGAMTVALLALIVYLRAWGDIVGELYIVHLSFIACLLASCLCSFICLLNFSLDWVLHIVCQMFLHFFNLAAFSFLLMEVLHIFILTYNIRQVFFTRWTYLSFGWGFALFITVAVVIASRVAGYNDVCHKLCWLSKHHWQFYFFLMPVVILVLIYLLLVGTCLWTFRKWNEEWRYADKKNYLSSLAKSSHLLSMLMASTLLAVGIESSAQTSQIVLHLVFLFGLVLSTALYRCVLDKTVRYQLRVIFCCSKQESPSMRAVRSSSSFRAFMKPEKVENAMNQEEYNVSRYYDEINRTKYTKERKQQLSSLLGSARSDDTKSSVVSGSSRENSRESECITTQTDDSNSENAGTDSGIFDYPDANGASSAYDVNGKMLNSDMKSLRPGDSGREDFQSTRIKDKKLMEVKQSALFLRPERVKSAIIEEPSAEYTADFMARKSAPKADEAELRHKDVQEIPISTHADRPFSVTYEQADVQVHSISPKFKNCSLSSLHVSPSSRPDSRSRPRSCDVDVTVNTSAQHLESLTDIDAVNEMSNLMKSSSHRAAAYTVDPDGPAELPCQSEFLV